MQSRSLVRRLAVAGSACSAIAISVALGASAQEEAVQSLESVELQSTDSIAEAFSDGARGGHAAGALVKVTLESKVGVLLDEIPQSQRAAAASYYLSRPSQFWRDRATLQMKHTSSRPAVR